MSYCEKLRDRRWQKKRLEVLSKARWKCENSNCQNLDDYSQLYVHHKIYRRNTEPWNYPLEDLEALCANCHLEKHRPLLCNGNFTENECYHWNYIFEALHIPDIPENEGNFLPMNEGHVNCGLFQKRFNPDAPEIILPGDEERIIEPTERFCLQSFPVPIFLKVSTSGSNWKYVGDYKVENWTKNIKEIEIHRILANRTVPISQILFLKKVK